jgi:two-component system, OmpR family, sensor histidine kinase MprB
MSLRVKLVLALVLVSTTATVAIGVWSYVATANRLYDEIDRSLTEATRETPQRLERGGLDVDGDERVPGRLPPPGRGLVDDTLVVQVIDPDGDVVASVTGTDLPVSDADRTVAAGAAREVRRDVTLDGEPYRILTFAVPSGAVQVARSLDETQRVLDSLRTVIVVAVVAVVVAAALAGWLIARQVTRRLVRLTDAAEQVGTTGRLDVDVDVGGSDEAGRLGTAFAGMLAALGRSREAQQRLVQDAGHELRTPLTSLRTNVSVLRRHDDLAPETRDRVLGDLDAETRELTELVNELVDLATDSSAEDEAVETVVLTDLVARVADRARRRTGRVVAVAGDDAAVVGRPAALERAVSNLLDNAAKFDESDAPIEVTVRDGRVEVCDRGPGIGATDLPYVFERFRRAVSARSRPGSGLGLSIVRDVAEAHGGTVFAADRSGGGACVGFTLPVVPPPPAP